MHNHNSGTCERRAVVALLTLNLISDLFGARCGVQDLSEGLSGLEPDHIHDEPLGAGKTKKQTNQ